jgi:hypothetical protein
LNVRVPGIHCLLAAGALAAPAGAWGADSSATRVTGTYELREGSAPQAGLDYRFDSPLLTGPEASARVDLTPALLLHSPLGEASYAVMSLERVLAAPGTIREWRPCTPMVARGSCGVFTDPPLCRGPYSRPVAQAAEVADPRALLRIRSLDLNPLTGRGEVRVDMPRDESFSTDPESDPYDDFEYQATGLLRVSTSGCENATTGEPVAASDGGPFAAVEDISGVVANGGPGFLASWGVSEMANENVPLRLSGGEWRGAFELRDPGNELSGGTETRVTITLRGTPVALRADCTVPRALLYGRSKPRAKAVRLIRRAGYAGVRLRARDKRTPGGRYVVDPAPFSPSCNQRIHLRRRGSR